MLDENELSQLALRKFLNRMTSKDADAILEADDDTLWRLREMVEEMKSKLNNGRGK